MKNSQTRTPVRQRLLGLYFAAAVLAVMVGAQAAEAATWIRR